MSTRESCEQEVIASPHANQNFAATCFAVQDQDFS
jgi:hypothetical protein